VSRVGIQKGYRYFNDEKHNKEIRRHRESKHGTRCFHNEYGTGYIKPVLMIAFKYNTEKGTNPLPNSMSSRIVPEAGKGGERAGGAVTGRGGSTGLPPGGGPPFRRTVEEERGSSS
jgi:hypothetical protein